MRRLLINLGVAALSMGMLLSALSAAKADPAMQLRNLVFDDGGTATGFFDLNVYGYLSNFSVATTAGSTLAGYTYIAGGPVGTPPSAEFTFNTANSVFELVLELASPLGYSSGGPDAIIAGSNAHNVLTGSYEECVSNANACGVHAKTVRLITAGTVYAPEPTALNLFGVGTALLFVARRRWCGAA